jgi:hypothetical protein
MAEYAAGRIELRVTPPVSLVIMLVSAHVGPKIKITECSEDTPSAL